MRKSDSQVQRDVIEELKWDPSVGHSEIGVAAADGVVTLTGQVDNYAKRFAAVRAAERVSGVRAVAEELIVRLPQSLERTDTDIAHAVVSALTWHTEIPEDRVKARVDAGFVWLEGDVDWQFQKDAAERAIRPIRGVRGVTNLLTIKQHASIPDVKLRIENAFKRHAELDAKSIRIDALDGKVVLRGKVRSWAERDDAKQAAWSAPGVTAVEDQLMISI